MHSSDPPPIKLIISIRSPSRNPRCANACRSRISRFTSTATRSGRISNSRKRSATVVPTAASRRSPFTRICIGLWPSHHPMRRSNPLSTTPRTATGVTTVFPYTMRRHPTALWCPTNPLSGPSALVKPHTPMTEMNRTLAAMFQTMADLLAAHQANPYRIRAYRRAAESLSHLPKDVAALAQRGALHQIPGIGRDLSSKIQEFLRTGTIQAYEELKTPLPSDVASWTSLPGLSEPVVHHLYFRLGIRTLADLEALVRSHLLRTLPGVTASDEALLTAIRARRRSGLSP